LKETHGEDIADDGSFTTGLQGGVGTVSKHFSLHLDDFFVLFKGFKILFLGFQAVGSVL